MDPTLQAILRQLAGPGNDPMMSYDAKGPLGGVGPSGMPGMPPAIPPGAGGGPMTQPNPGGMMPQMPQMGNEGGMPSIPPEMLMALMQALQGRPSGPSTNGPGMNPQMQQMLQEVPPFPQGQVSMGQ